mmetsp:Transcript_36563/g.146143  ORF Transcript_36563/g.146143 Transcript_36563/m.146143 type:complete len:299 (-) Transcript_36563:654-1550(-)
MTRCFDRQLGILAFDVQLNTLINNVLVPPLESKMDSALRLYEGTQSIRRDRVSNYRRPLVFLQHDARNYSDQSVLVNFVALSIHHTTSINIRVEHYPKICGILDDSFRCHFHCNFILGVGHMVWKRPIWVQELAPSGICTELIQYSMDKETPRSVSGINKDLGTCQRTVVVFWIIALPPDYIHQMLGISGHEVLLFNICLGVWNRFAASGIHCIRCVQKNSFDVSFSSPSLAGEKLEPISVLWEMTGREHDGTIKRDFTKYCRHEHCRSCRQLKVSSGCSRRGNSLCRYLQQLGPRQP